MTNDGPPDDWGESPPRSGSTDPISDSVAREADKLRTAWILAVREHVQRQTNEPCTYNSKICWDGGYCRDTRRTYKPVWPKLVLKARSEGLDPVRLVAVLFAAWGTGPSPRPHDIVSPANVARYHTHVRLIGQRARIALGTEEVIYKSAVWSASQAIPDPEAAVRFALNDMSRKMTPLFRYSIATMKNMADVADRWRDLARDQICRAPEGYLAAWSLIIPQDVAAAAKAAVGKVA